MNQNKKLTPEDLEDGSMLKNAMKMLHLNPTEDQYFETVRLLRDSRVWIPYSAVMSEEDLEQIDQRIKETNGQPENIVGTTFQTKAKIRMIPDILQNGDQFFFPVFTSVEETGEYGEHFSIFPQQFLEAMILAKNNAKNVTGIVVNPFSAPHVVERDIFDVIKNIPSRLV